jgi:hypothetical protein
VSVLEAVKYQPEITSALNSLGLTTTTFTANSRWSKLIIHGIPTSIGEGTVAATALSTALHLAAPSITLAQPPQWLSTQEQRKGKSHSSMVVALSAKFTLQH